MYVCMYVYIYTKLFVYIFTKQLFVYPMNIFYENIFYKTTRNQYFNIDKNPSDAARVGFTLGEDLEKVSDALLASLDRLQAAATDPWWILPPTIGDFTTMNSGFYHQRFGHLLK